MPRINISTDSVQNIARRMEFAQEEIREAVLNIDKEIDTAELEGWNDKTYYEFKESYIDTKVELMNALKRIEEDHMVYLKKILRNTEDLI